MAIVSIFRKINLFIFFIMCFTTSVFALDWNSEKYQFADEDPYFMVKVQPETKEYNLLCEASKTGVWERVFKEKKQEFVEFVNSASRVILDSKSIMYSSSYQKRWEKAFRDAQISWLEQLERDREDFFYTESALGGNTNERASYRFAVEKIEVRIENIKKRWWMASGA